MDFLEDYIPRACALYNNYYAPYKTYLLPLQRTILTLQSHFYTYLFPYLYPLLRLSSSLAQSLLTENPSILTLALLAIVLITSLKVLDMLRRTVVYWISVAIRLALYVGVAALGSLVYYRGLEQTVEDVGWVMGLFAGLEEEGQRVGRGRAREKRGRAGDLNLGKRTPRGRTRGAGW